MTVDNVNDSEGLFASEWQEWQINEKGTVGFPLPLKNGMRI